MNKMIELFKKTFRYILLHILKYISGVYDKAVDIEPSSLEFVPDWVKTEEMCERPIEKDPWILRFVPDQYKMQEMCDKAFWEDTFSLEYIPDWFVTQQQLKLWRDYDDYCNDDKLIEWYDGYKKHKAQKASIKDELMPIAWHPDRVMHWCMSEDEKRWWK